MPELSSVHEMMSSLSVASEVSLDVVPDLIQDASPMSDPSLTSTPVQEFEKKGYFNSKGTFEPEIQIYSSTTTSIIASQVAEKKKKFQHTPLKINDILSEKLNPAHSMFNLTPFEPSAEGPCFATTSQTFWYHKASSQLSELLQGAQYPTDLQTQYMNFFNHSIIPAFGPIPAASETWTPRLTHTRSPFEPSLNICGQVNVKPENRIHFTIEPISPVAGTNEDLFNQLIARFFVSALAASKTFPSIDLTWWHHFTDELFISSAETQRACELSAECPAPSSYLYFELPNDDFAPVLKACLFPTRRALLDGKSKTEVLLSAVKKLHSHTTFLLPGIETVEAFLSASHPASGTQENKDEMSLEMLSFDCVASEQSCIELYLKTSNTPFTNIEYIYNLGGVRKSAETATGLSLFKQLLNCLASSGSKQQGDKDVYDTKANTTPHLYFNLEILPGNPIPSISIYVPAWTLGMPDSEIRKGLGKFFKETGWEIQGYEDIGNVLTHTYICFSYNEKKGVEVSICYSPVMENL